MSNNNLIIMDFITSSKTRESFSIQAGADQTDKGILLRLLDKDGDVIACFHNNGQVTFESLPTSATGLSAGSLWNDTGTLKII